MDENNLVNEMLAQFGAAEKPEAKKEEKKPGEEDREKKIPKPNAKKILEAIKRSEKIKKPFKEDGDRYYSMYEGELQERGKKKKKKSEQMNVNIIFSHVEIMSPAIFSGFPYIKVKPKPKPGEKKEDALARAVSMERTVNYWLKELAVDRELKRVLLDQFFYQAGLEVGWETQTDEIVEKFTDKDGVEKEGTKIVVLKDQPFVKRFDPDEIIFDPDAKVRSECGWYALRETMKWNTFLGSSKFTDKAKNKCKPQTYPQECEKEQGEKKEASSEKEWIRIYTYWDRENHRVCVVTEGYDGFLNTDDEEGGEWPYEMEYQDDPFPFVIIDGKPDRKSPYTWSDFRAYESQILEQNRIRNAIQIHLKSSLPKYMYTKHLGGRTKANKLINARSDEATEVDNLEAIKAFQHAEIPKDLYNFNGIARDDISNVSGISEFQNESLADTATESQILEGRSQARKSQKSRYWEQSVVELAGKLAQLCQENMDQAIVVEIAGEQGSDWVEINKDQIQGEFLYDIEAGIMEYKNENMRKQQLLKFMELTGNDPNVNRRAIVSKVAKELDMDQEEVILPIDKIAPPPPPEPTIKFKDIDPTIITDPVFMNAIVREAMLQNNVKLPEPAGVPMQGGAGPLPPPPGPGAPPPQLELPLGQDLAGGNPNGNMSLPPVEGNQMDPNLGGTPGPL